MKNKKSKTNALLLAIFLGFWAWLYTYEVDSVKFWIGAGCVIATFLSFFMLIFITFPVLLILHTWALIETILRTEEFYEKL